MRSTQIIAALAAFASLSAAGPAFDTEKFEKTFTVGQEDTGRKYIKHASLDQYRTWLRYNGTVPKEIEDAAAAAAQGSVKNQPTPFDAAYLTPVKIGTPPQTLMLNIDTGSSDLWVFSSQQPAAEKRGHSFYSPGKSSSSKKKAGQSWSIRYGDGSKASGNVFADKVTLAGITVPNQAVEAAQQISRSLASDRAQDGIFGFGFSNINTIRPTPAKTWAANAGPKLQKNLFCADLRHGAPGFYDFGFINPAHHSGAVHYAPVTRRNGFWQFSTSAYYVGNKQFGGDFANAIADTGTSLLYVTPGAATNYYRKVPKAMFNNQVKQYIFPCSTKLPSFSIVIGGSKRVIPGKYMSFAPVGTLNGVKYCQGGIQKSPQAGLQILGDIFLKSQYVVFDQAKTRIGFADKK